MTRFTLIAAAALAALPATAQASGGAMAQAQVAPVAHVTRNAGRERHPEIRKAIRQLEKARADLQRAAHDFGGHRADALAAVDNAIKQLNLALQYDRQ